ncbi:MAG: hypothetical protein QNJ16_07020 [Rhodobacter sp.]|nr:hypothetical protein [Rhodobacter sp.]
MIRLIALAALATAAACTAPPAGQTTGSSSPPEVSELRFGGAYRFANDPCRRVGETALTAPFLDDQADLVACPVDYEGRGRFAIDSNSTEVARTDGWVVYSVPIP